MIYLLQHLKEFWPALVMCLMTGLLLVEIPCIKRQLISFAPGRLNRMVIGLFVGATCFVGWTKGPVAAGKHVAQFVTALMSGGIVDESGLVATSSEQETVAAFADLALSISLAAQQTVTDASNDFAAVAGLVTNQERRVIYIQSSLPRTDPSQGLINHNISAFTVRTAMSDDQSVISRYVWYSQEPQVAPTVACVIDVGGGPIKLTSITNSFPDTTTINGIDCVRYDFAVPEGSRHVVFFPDTELTFGSQETFLEIGSAGVLLTVGEKTYLPYTGTDVMFGGRVEIDFKGGIAVACRIDGIKVKDGVYEL